ARRASARGRRALSAVARQACCCSCAFLLGRQSATQNSCTAGLSTISLLTGGSSVPAPPRGLRDVGRRGRLHRWRRSSAAPAPARARREQAGPAGGDEGALRCGPRGPPAGAPAPVTYASASRAHATVVTSDFISTPRVGDVLAVGRNDAKNAGFVQRLSGEQQVRQVSLDCVFRSAVSQSVRQLEEQLRVVLLPRTTHSVSLTDAGRCLVETAGPALAQAPP